VSDADREVRLALRQLLQEVALPLLPAGALAPFAPLLALHTAGAMTHMDERVRRDALGVLELLLQSAPGAAVGAAPSETLRHFDNLLQAGGAGGVRWRPGHLLEVVGTLRGFLGALRPQLGSLPEPEAPPGEEGEDGAVRQWQWRDGAPAPPPLLAARGWGAGCATERPAAAAAAAADAAQALGELAPRLGAVAAQMAPSLGEPGGADGPTLQCLTSVLLALTAVSACRAAAAAAAASPARDAARATPPGAAAAAAARTELLPLLRRSFPVGAACAPRTQDGRALVAQLNLAAAALLLEEGGAGEGWSAKEREAEAHARAAALAHLCAALRGESAPGGAVGDDAVRTPREAYPELLRLAGAVLLLEDARGEPCAPPPQRFPLLDALTALWEASPARSAEKAACLGLLARLLARGGAFAPPQLAQRWLAAMPRLLFELRHTAPRGSCAALGLLRRAACGAGGGAPGAPLSAALVALEPQLAPFFALPGGAGARGARAGPFLRLPPEAQSHALALLSALPSLSPATLRAAALCVLSPGAHADCAAQAAEAVAHAAGAGAAQRARFLATLLLGCDEAGETGLALPPGGGSADGGAATAARGEAAGAQGWLSWGRRLALSRAARSGLAALAPGLPGGLWQALADVWPLHAAQLPRHAACALLEAAGDALACAAEPQQHILQALPPLLAAYLLASSKEGALASPPALLARCADAEDPQSAPAARVLALCHALAAPLAAQLAQAAAEDAALTQHGLAAIAAIASCPQAHAALLAGAQAVQAAAARITQAAQGRYGALLRHLELTLRDVLG